MVLEFCKKAVKLMEDHAPLSKLVKTVQRYHVKLQHHMVETHDPLVDAPFTKFGDPLITCTLHMILDDEVVGLVLRNYHYVSQ